MRATSHHKNRDKREKARSTKWGQQSCHTKEGREERVGLKLEQVGKERGRKEVRSS